MTTVSLGYAEYVGGLPGRSGRQKGRLWASDDAVGFGPIGPAEAVLNTADVVGVDIESVEEIKSKVPAVLAFGVLGALTARGFRRKTAVTVSLADGAIAYFVLDTFDVPTARSLITPWLQSRGLVGVAAVRAPSPNDPTGLVELLERVADLHRSGALTDEQFEAAKAKLLS